MVLLLQEAEAEAVVLTEQLLELVVLAVAELEQILDLARQRHLTLVAEVVEVHL
tara:strand:- start:61 stop:222 length:162 start_codon:yes stop_codon:yes gene_type:complete